MIPSSDSVRLAATIIEQICAADGLHLDGPTIDAAIQSQVAKLTAQMGVTDRTAAGCVPLEKLAVEVAANLIIAHDPPQRIRHNPADPPTGQLRLARGPGLYSFDGDSGHRFVRALEAEVGR